MAQTKRILGTLVVAAASVSSGCGSPGVVGDAVRPDAPKVQKTLCDSVADFGQPLVVDLKAHERAVYEAVMKDGVAVVSYDCNALHIIKDCKIDGDYGFVGVSPKEEVVRLDGADEIALNLPSFGAKIAAEVKRDASLDLGLIMIGMRRTTVDVADRKRLKGTGCDKATHFVRGAFLGAFALKQGSSGSTSAAVDIMGIGAGASSTSSKRTENRDGDASACKKFSPSSTSPDPSCSALLRLELTALEVAPRQDGGSADVCPKDLVLVDGKCAPPSSAAFQCREGQLSECVAECEKGHAGSCAAASFMYFGNLGVASDPEQAATLARKACDGGSARGCSNLGHAYDRGDALPHDLTKARELYARGCEGGYARGCSNLGVLTENAGDAAKADALFERGCNGGEARACHFLALNVDKGKGTTADPAKAKALFVRACNGKHEDACALLSSQLLAGSEEERAKGLKGLEDSCTKGSASACRFLGGLRLSGTKLPKDPVRAEADFERACEGKDWKSCVDAATLSISGREGVPKAPEKAPKLVKKACTEGHTPACRLLAVSMLQSLGVPKDDAGAVKLLEKSCSDGDAESCAGAGLLYRNGFGTSANASLAAGMFEKSCQGRYGYGCALLAAARFDGSAPATRDVDGVRAALARGCSAGYGPACGLAYSPPRVYTVTGMDDAFGTKVTAAGAAAPSPAANADSASPGASAPKKAATEAAPSDPELEKRRSTLRDRFKAKLAAIKTCPKGSEQSHRVGFVVGPDGATQVTMPSRGSDAKFDACLEKVVRSITIPAGTHTIKGIAIVHTPTKGDTTIELAIQPDPSEFTLPANVRRFAGCACGAPAAEAVCAIECRTGGGSGSGSAGPGTSTGPVSESSFDAKTTAPPPPAKASAPPPPKKK